MYGNLYAIPRVGVVQLKSDTADWMQWTHDIRCLLRWADCPDSDWGGTSVPFRVRDSARPFFGPLDWSRQSPWDLAEGALRLGERWIAEAEAAIQEGEPQPPRPSEPIIGWWIAQPLAGEPATGSHRQIPDGLFAGQPMIVCVRRERRPDADRVLPLLSLQSEAAPDLQFRYRCRDFAGEVVYARMPSRQSRYGLPRLWASRSDNPEPERGLTSGYWCSARCR